jgi:predicted phage terminase large subunit-like protein
MTAEQAKVIKMAKYKTLTSFLFFTRYFFHKRFHRKFIIGPHHILISDALEKVVSGEIKRLIINIAPRYGKTIMAVHNLIAYGLALNPSAKFIHLSYANELAMDNSEEVKEIIKSDAFQELFPQVQIKQRTDSKHKWYTTDGGGVYATAAGGQVTGFGAGKVDLEDDGDLEEFMSDIEQKQEFAGALIIDDPIKPEDADSVLIREKVNKRFDSTIRNRVNSRKTPIIIIMQRLHDNDLCGYLLTTEPKEWYVLSLPCIKADGTALWEFKHTLTELQQMAELNPIVFQRQYMQKADAIEGRLYKKFHTYKELPLFLPTVKAVIDTADEGSDYLCSIVYVPTADKIYILDVIYTQSGMEVTEPQAARQLTGHNVRECRVESNAGGRSFARNIERLCREQKNYTTAFIWYHQNKNKISRIFTQAAEVQNMLYYPEDWEIRWPIFSRAVKSYLMEGGNAHDDGPDTLTMIIEAEKMGNYQIL